ncbi:MAG: hypothetical protein ACOX3Z_01460 [Bacillota bacterium]
MPVVTAVDLLGIQRYIFGSHRLADAVSASWLVHWATSTEQSMSEDLPAGALYEYRDCVLASGGGTAILEFCNEDEAKRFAAKYTRTLMDKAPGLEAVVVHKDYEPGHLAECLMGMGELVAQAKSQRLPSAELLGLGVTARCSIAGRPAVKLDDEDGPISKMVTVWRSDLVTNAARQRWERFLNSSASRYHFPPNINHMGRSTGVSSLCGVVHIDGNGTGDKIQEWLGRCRQAPDEEVRRQYREWSQAINDTLEAAFQTVLDDLLAAITDGKVNGKVKDLEFDLFTTDLGIALPLRPLILGGDDLTFICDGRIAPYLAQKALERFDGVVIPHLGKWSACAGVAIVHTRYPFFRAYDMAASLCRNAKDERRARQHKGSWIDWHVGSSSKTLNEIRRTHYTFRHYDKRFELTCRPYKLGSDSEPDTWKWLSEVLLGSSDAGFRSEMWSQRKNKLMTLMELSREGPDAIERALQAWRVQAPNLRFAGLGDDGFLEGRRTPLLDAIELLDVHLPLRAKDEKEVSV